MIRQLSGIVIQAGATSFVIDCGGVGYGAETTPATAASLRVGEPAVVYTSLVVREDSQTLYGFATAEERDTYELVQSVSGVGPRLATAIVAVLPGEELRQAITSEDLARLCAVPGIGKKSAQRLVIELKDKVTALGTSAPSSTTVVGSSTELWREQVSTGLEGLGWSAKDAAQACENIAHLVEPDTEVNIAVLMRAALGSLARR